VTLIFLFDAADATDETAMMLAKASSAIFLIIILVWFLSERTAPRNINP
jgi:hypothetical protein